MKITEGKFALGGLAALAFWVFVVLPIYYGPRGSENPRECAAEQDKNYGFWEKARCDPIAYFTLWLVGFTGVLAGVSIFQGYMLLRADQSTRLAAEAAKTNADAAMKSAEIAERSFTHSQNVSFGFTAPGGFQDVAARKIPYLDVQIKNLGRGDAYGISYTLEADLFVVERLAEPFEMPRPEPGTGVIPSGESITRRAQMDRAITAAEVEAIDAGQLVFAVWGLVICDAHEYEDPFSYTLSGGKDAFGKCEIKVITEDKKEDGDEPKQLVAFAP